MIGKITGRLTRDPELKTGTADGKEWAVCKFSIAMDNHFGAKTSASFYECEIWNKRAEAVAKFFHKGDVIAVDGYLEQEEYTGKDGMNKRRWKVDALSFDFVGKGKNAETKSEPTLVEIKDEDIPF